MASPNYSLWDDEDGVIPPRSRLYSLKMDGSDGNTQEALLDYCQRLASAHCVSIKDLLRTEIIPLTQICGARFISRFSQAYAKTINGYGKYADQIAEALQELTMQPALTRGTFLHWKGIFDPKGSGLLHPQRRWCPSCLADAQEHGSLVSHALIWSVSVVSHCPIHLTPLRDICEQCGMAQLFLSDQAALGRCSHCGAPLGAPDGLWSYVAPSERQQFFSKAVAGMIAMGDRAQELAKPELLAARLKEVVQLHFGGSIRHLEREIGYRKTSTAKWFRMEARPQFNLLLELCYRISVLPVDLLSGEFIQSAQECHIRKLDTPAVQPHKKPDEAMAKEIPTEILLICESDSEYVNATDFCKKHGISVGYLKYWFPESYNALTSHRRRVQALLTQAKIERLEAETRAIVRRLYADSANIPRRRIAVALSAAGISIQNPLVRAAAFDERERLESQLYTPPMQNKDPD